MSKFLFAPTPNVKWIKFRHQKIESYTPLFRHTSNCEIGLSVGFQQEYPTVDGNWYIFKPLFDMNQTILKTIKGLPQFSKFSPRSSFLVVASEAKVRHYECTLPSHLEFSFSWGHTVVLLATPYFSKQLLENAGGERKLETAVSASLSFLFLMHLHLHSYSKTKKMSWDFHTVKTQNVY